MEAYPQPYVEHNLPLVLLSGLGDGAALDRAPTDALQQKNGTKITAQSPESSSERAGQLSQHFLRRDGSNSAWNAASLPGPTGALKFRFKDVGRNYILPPRKAAPLPQSPSEDFGQGQTSPPRPTELHSTLSPLSPGSPLCPDGLFTPLWLAKHNTHIPAMMLSFFDITAGEGATQDDQLKADINGIRNALSRSGFKTKFAVVLLSDKSILQAPELEDRLSSIRRATMLDPKSGLFFMPPMSSNAEIATFVHGVLATLQPLCVEYFRDLTKHARRKKARSSIPTSATTAVGGGTHALSTTGWNARYEIKQGAFAEFRQEMDVAERHYSQAIEDLFSSEGVFEVTPSWSPRWNEARLIADTLALRVLRCALWSGFSASAVQSWAAYKFRMKDLLDRRGKGSQTYGWQAWEARWAEIMAQLIRRAELPAFKDAMKQSEEDSPSLAPLSTYATPEKAFQGTERLQPFLMLHHPGYWYRLAFQSARARKEKAFAIPEEDRVPPEQSPASAVASRAQNYDAFLVPEPHEEYPLPGRDGFDHVEEISRLSNEAGREFYSRGQSRLSDHLKLELGQDLAESGHFTEALAILTPLWEETSWRDENWHTLFGELLKAMLWCAREARDAQLVLATTWESLRNNPQGLPPKLLDLTTCLDELDDDTAKDVSFSFLNCQRLSPISVGFAFRHRQGNVGEPLQCQLVLRSQARDGSADITIRGIHLSIHSLPKIRINHSETQASASYLELSLNDREAVQEGAADLTLRPSEEKILSFPVTFREARIARVSELKVLVTAPGLRVEQIITDQVLLNTPSWFHPIRSGFEHHQLSQEDTTAVTVLPKPPKIHVILHNTRAEYYLGERVRLTIEIVNEEAETISGTIDQKAIMPSSDPVPTEWLPHDQSESENIGKGLALTHDTQTLTAIQPLARKKLDLVIEAPAEPLTCSCTVEVVYTLVSEPNTLLRKTVVIELPFVALLQAKFNFAPVADSRPWPSYFDPMPRNSEAEPSGVPQHWKLVVQLVSLAVDEIVVRDAKITAGKIANNAVNITLGTKEIETQNVAPNATFSEDFLMMTQKWSLDDRRPTILDLSVVISWSRGNDSPVFVTALPMPRLTIPSSEPRVLCTLIDSPDHDTHPILQYHLENPSTHFLTFALTMEANEDFAFSGPKYRTLSLAPLSRHKVEYRIVMHASSDGMLKDDDRCWIWPVLQVVDSYYQKTLRVQAAGPGVKLDIQRGLGVKIARRNSLRAIK